MWSLPDSPAAAALDIARSTAAPPSIMQRFGFEMLNADDATGFAGEISPLLVYRDWFYDETDPNRLLTIDDYQGNRATRAWARVQVSAAAVRSDQGRNRAALGVRWTAFNLGDPYARHPKGDAYHEVALYNAPAGSEPAAGCLVKASGPSEARDRLEEGGEDTWTEREEQTKKAFADCVAKFQSAAWNATSLQVMAVQTWESEGEGFGELDDSGARVLAVLSYGFEGVGRSQRILRQNSQLLLSAGYGAAVRKADEDGDVVERDETTLGLRIRFAPPLRAANADQLSPSEAGRRRANGVNFNVYAEAAWSRNDYAAAPDQEEWVYTFGAEYQLPWAENVWLGVSSQRRSGDDVTGEETSAGLQLRWAMSDKPQWARN